MKEDDFVWYCLTSAHAAFSLAQQTAQSRFGRLSKGSLALQAASQLAVALVNRQPEEAAAQVAKFFEHAP